ncbi:hypothetical protein PDE_00763 [Penicillium oxalicum 114-2]|uniref:Mid2 domain-containing protein n=1 Tax=Penicillium oxalicum (strain 114-2 / CGMCC 5302) TaxID=933388 RepID=S8AVG0_PENO1|nr:hypothetical protein PDE_00763 [Penicillium oxalicum 114-2]
MTSTRTAPVPLTTVFNPPSSCSRLEQVSSECQKDCSGLYNIVQTTDPNCFPSGWATTATWFSPGINCPKGYTINDSNTVTSGLQITETQARCCPSGYTIATDLPHTWWTAEPCTKVIDTTTTLEFTVYSATGASPTITTQMTITGPIIHAYPVELRWQSTDSQFLVPGQTTAPTGASLTNASPSPASTPADSPPTSTSSSISPSSSSSSSSSGLSTGTKAGIGIGVAAGAIAIIALVFFLWRRRGKKNRMQYPGDDDDPSDEIPVRQVPGHMPVELPTPVGTRSQEVHGQSRPWASELDAGPNRYGASVNDTKLM